MVDMTLLNAAFTLHYAKRFGEACVAYQVVLDTQPTPEQASVARQQLENLKAFAPRLQP